MKVGVLGGGQLGRMMALAGLPLGLRFLFLDSHVEACAGDIGELIAGSFRDEDLLGAFARHCDVVTLEFENVPVESVQFLASRVATHPNARSLEVTQDRLHEKDFFRSAGLRTVPYLAVETQSELRSAAAQLGYPCVVKTRRMGYDGKGQALLRNDKDLENAWNALGEAPLIVEQFLEFERELSLVGVRTRSGEVSFYPVVENIHVGGILHKTIAPAPKLDARLQKEAEDAVGAVLEGLDFVGAGTVEFFEADGRLVANEMAPRVHNSGHWTIEGAWTSQFSNHLRAVCGLPLGSTRPRAFAGMVNLLGEPASGVQDLMASQGCFVHLYNKSSRPGRKVGHVTVCADTEAERDALLSRVESLCANAVPR